MMFRRRSSGQMRPRRRLLGRKAPSKEAQRPGRSRTQGEPVLGHLLSNLSFPVKSQRALISALGGSAAKIRVDGLGVLSAEEIADLCFSEARAFEDPDQIVRAVRRASWVRVVTRRLNFQWFPIHGPGRLVALVGEVSVDGVKARNLLSEIDYPVTSVPDLLEKIARARGLAG